MITNYFDVQRVWKDHRPEVWNGAWPDDKKLTVHRKPLGFEDRKLLLSIQEIATKRDLKEFHLVLAEKMSIEATKKDIYIADIPENLRLEIVSPIN